MAGFGDIMGGPAAWAVPGLRQGMNKAGGNVGNGLGEFFMGTPGKVMQSPLYNQQQQGAMGGMLSQAMGGLSGNQFNFDPIEKQARRDFEQKTAPGLAERFSMMGSGGGQRSSAFSGAMNQAGAGLEGDLAAMRSQYGMLQQGQLMKMLQMALKPQFENTYMPSSGGFLGGMSGGMGQGAGQGLASMLPMLMAL